MFMFAVHVGGPRDTPEMRERIRRVRRVCLGKLYSNYIFKHLKKKHQNRICFGKTYSFSFFGTEPEFRISPMFVRLTNLYYSLAKLPDVSREIFEFRISNKKLEF